MAGSLRRLAQLEEQWRRTRSGSDECYRRSVLRRHLDAVAAACLLQPPRALSRDVTECRSGITARALAAQSAAGRRMRMVLVRAVSLCAA